MYTLREDPPDAVQKELKEYDAISQRLLFARGITDKKEAGYFFDTTWEETDPYRYRSMYAAAERVLKAIRDNEVIGIYSDYDCDGIPAAAAVYSTLFSLGHQAVTYYVPDRNRQGFGVHKEGVEHMMSKQSSVVCVLDCGTAHPDEIALMQSAGIDVVILDHHLPGSRTPDAFAIINPTLEEGINEPHPMCRRGRIPLYPSAYQTGKGNSAADTPSARMGTVATGYYRSLQHFQIWFRFGASIGNWFATASPCSEKARDPAFKHCVAYSTYGRIG